VKEIFVIVEDQYPHKRQDLLDPQVFIIIADKNFCLNVSLDFLVFLIILTLIMTVNPIIT
jgi:hypothetical protein